MTHRRSLLLGALAMPALAHAQTAWAPTRPMRFVVPFPAGGATDIVARVMADRMGEKFGQPVVVENRTGAGGNIGVEAVVRSAPDGHTILMGTTGTLTINPHLYANMGFSPATDLAPISMAFTTDSVLIVNPAVPAQNAAEFLALARARPGTLSYGSAGSGSSTHMVTELFRLVAGIQVQHVPYRGSAPALNDTVAGTVNFMMDQVPSALGQIQGGRVRALAITGPRRSRLLPDVPTMAEIGLPAAESTSWGSVMAPAGTPPAAIAALAAACAEVLAQPAVLERLATAGADGVSSTPAALAAFMASESTKWARVVREASITVN
ncbi:Bug family tripartite tricarboxylate transporter substrate binding protein [Humitalea sp. 24SJ18S-53]|uniref:Bug family tripartite tricarboxylate transporter substrate binding protein n=1 Tax=Humitalea sp. 24SJ18S-53 TaxID=3422307 RepID=UPI003D673FA6